MFGYVIANIDALDAQQKAYYRACYCGLCRTLGTRYGAASRTTLSYDMVFLILLLGATQETGDSREFSARCAIHPLKPHACWQNAYTGYAADCNVLLAYDQLMDHWRDSRNAAALVQARALRTARQFAVKRLPRQAAALQQGMAALHQAEAAGETNPDIPSAIFAGILEEFFVPDGAVQAQALRAFGHALGRFIYLMDAAVDLRGDLQHERYNPLSTVASSKHETILQTQMALCASLFEGLKLYRDRPLLENILYSGVWTRYLAKQQPAKGAKA